MAIVRDHTFAINELDLQDFTVAKLDLAILTVKVLTFGKDENMRFSC